VLNNAIEMEDTTFLHLSVNRNKFAAAMYYQSPLASESGNEIDYNIYAYSKNDNVHVDAYRAVITDVSGVVVDFGYRDEYKTLSNWQNWMKTDVFSSNKSFVNFFEKSEELIPKFRYIKDPIPVNCPLERRGTYLREAEVDIDGYDRTKGDQRLDIGAQLLSGIRFTSDIEVLNIIEPATYFSGIGPLSDAEYFMIKDEPIKVKVLLRNNGNGSLINHPITLRIYEEPRDVNNFNADLHNNNFDVTYYNNEISHNLDRTTFRPIQSIIDNPNNPPATFFEETKIVNIASGEGAIIEFDLPLLTQRFKAYNTFTNYTVPMQFSNFSSLIRTDEYYEIILKHYNCSLEIIFHVRLCHYRTEVEYREQLSITPVFCGKT
jgi:hypothetical protein